MGNNTNQGVDEVFADFFGEPANNKKSSDETIMSSKEELLGVSKIPEMETTAQSEEEEEIKKISVENTSISETNIDDGFGDLFKSEVKTEGDVLASDLSMELPEEDIGKFSENVVNGGNSTNVTEDLSLLDVEDTKNKKTIEYPIEDTSIPEVNTDDGFGDLFSPSPEEPKEKKDINPVTDSKETGEFEDMFSSSKKQEPVNQIIEQPVLNEDEVSQNNNGNNFDKKKKAIIGIIVLILLVVGGGYSYLGKSKNTDGNSTSSGTTNINTKTDIVDVNSKISDDEAIKKILDEYKSKGLAEDLKNTNLEIKDIKVLDDFNGYKENNLKFILVQYQPILTDEAITSFLIDINKATQEQVKLIKDSGKFEQVKVLMTQYYEKQYGELLKLGTLGVLYKKGEGDYVIMKMGDYFKEKFYNSGVYDIRTKEKMSFIASYISYDKNYFGKDKDKVLQLSNIVMEELKTEEGKKFLNSVNTYFFAK